MNQILKFIKIIIINIAISIIYVLLHELGHVITSVLLGGKVVKINLFPIAYVVTDLVSVKLEYAFILIGFSGTAFPLLLSIILSRIKSENSNYFWGIFSLKVQNVVNSIYFSAILVLYNYNVAPGQNDVTEMLKQNDKLYPLYFAITIVFLLISIKELIITKEKFIKEIKTF